MRSNKTFTVRPCVFCGLVKEFNRQYQTPFRSCPDVKEDSADYRQLYKMQPHPFQELKQKVECARSGFKDNSTYETDLLDLLKRCQRVASSWSQSSLGAHADLYFGEFQKPTGYDIFNPEWGLIKGIPEGWNVRSPEEATSQIEKEYTGQPLENTELSIGRIAASMVELKEELTIELAWIHQVQSLSNESGLLKEIDKLDLIASDANFFGALTTCPPMSRDSTAVHQGKRIAPHIPYQAKVSALIETLKRIRFLLATAWKLLRLLERHEEVVPSVVESTSRAGSRQVHWY